MNNKLLALIVDDETGIRRTLTDIFEDEGWDVVSASNGLEGIDRYKKFLPNLVLLDVCMPRIDGIQTLQLLKEIDPNIPIVVMSGHGTIETAVKATKIGAFDYLEKPLSLDNILPLLEHAKNVVSISESVNRGDDRVEMVGESSLMQAIKRQIRLVAPRNSWVLITGENGTGKEVLARCIHDYSTRSNCPFVAVNCAAIPEDLIESELFGHQKGAFTNAISSKQGKFEIANGGTLFLDEIGDMSLKTQAKILRILQEQKFERVGGTDEIEVDVRVLAATNKSLKEEISKGNFREDLYYRLNVIPFFLPPLRERGEDIRVLTQYFLEQFSLELGEPKKVISDCAYKVMKSYNWPGNIRELRNVLERLCIMVPEQVIRATHLHDLLVVCAPENVRTSSSGYITAGTLKQAKTDFERAFILDKLEEFEWNVTKTAEAIGVERSNLHRKLKGFGIEAKFRGER